MNLRNFVFASSALCFVFVLTEEAHIAEEKVSEYHMCTRECKKNQNMDCYYKFTLEQFVTMGRSCDYCNKNATRLQLARVPHCQCAFADGFERGILTINRMLPGPSIQVCRGDKIIVDVDNRMSGMETTIHWHGVHLKGYPFYDGVPFITQCPIHGGNTFRYRFSADNPGTHFYHSHSSVQKLDGLYGAFVIRAPLEEDPHAALYDYDLPEHTIVISDFLHTTASERIPGFTLHDSGQYPETLLINGRGRFFDFRSRRETHGLYEEIVVSPGRRYRLRIINSLGTSCDARLTIEQHSLKIISTDGRTTVPVVVDSLVSHSGERYDVVINTKRKSRRSFWIHVWSEECYRKKVHQVAILRYTGTKAEPPSMKPTYDRKLTGRKIYQNACQISPLEFGKKRNQDRSVCPTDLRAYHPPREEILPAQPDLSLFLPYELLFYNREDIFMGNIYKHFILPPSTRPITGLIDGISFVLPPSPPLTQYEDLPPGTLCSSRRNLPRQCAERENCACTHTINIPSGHHVEIILVDRSENVNTSLPHPFHLHGHSFRVMAHGVLPSNLPPELKTFAPLLDEMRRKIADGSIREPPLKDTILIPHRGFVVLRVNMDNPGFWFLHCHFGYHIVIGMNMIFHVGNSSHIPKLPRHFPKCGNFLD